MLYFDGFESGSIYYNLLILLDKYNINVRMCKKV